MKCLSIILNYIVNKAVDVYMGLCSISLIVAVYFVKEDDFFINIFEHKEFFSCVIYLAVSIIMAYIGLLLLKNRPNDCINKEIKIIDLRTNSFLPNYLGYFFVALSVSSDYAIIFVLCIILLFVIASNVHYFNPFFLLFGYKFYHVETSINTKIFIISKRNIRANNSSGFNQLKRINDFTFIEIGGVK